MKAIQENAIQNEEQRDLWNGPAAQNWIDGQALLDGMFEPFEQLLVEPLARGSAEWVLDIGCGTGATTLAAAQRLGVSGRAVGIDLSAPMIEVARARAARAGSAATFISGDAQTQAFESATFDVFISRFGTMFFDDPVRAFANLRRAAKPGARLDCIVWRSAAENPFMTTAERAAAPLLPNIPPRQPDAPGQFAFADPQRVQKILSESGWTHIDLGAIDVPCVFPAKELERYSTRMGPVGLALQQADEATRSNVSEAVRVAFAPFVHGAEARFDAACWRVRARA
jgi:SAM-dependent methyltransferase